MRTHWYGDDGAWNTTLRGRQVFGNPRINKGTGFPPEERDALGLVGLMPYRVLTLEQQADRAYNQYSAEPDNLAKNVYLTALHDRNEVLYYRLVADHLREMLPIVYTPTIGDAIERYSHLYRRPRGVYLALAAPELIQPGTAAVNLAAVLSGVAASGVPLTGHRVVIFGAGTAGAGIAQELRDAMVAAGLSEPEATGRIWALARHGLITDDMDGVRDFQRPWA